LNVANRDEYRAYSRQVTGDIAPRQVLILVGWESEAAFESYRNDPPLADLHPHRENGASDYVWHLSDALDDLRLILKPDSA
jgi:heme-degrading monooxygenase HmoA